MTNPLTDCLISDNIDFFFTPPSNILIFYAVIVMEGFCAGFERCNAFFFFIGIPNVIMA